MNFSDYGNLLNFSDLLSNEGLNESLHINLSKSYTKESNFSIVTNFCDDKKLRLAFLSLPILVTSLVLEIFIKNYHGSLDVHEKNIVVFFDIAITNYLQEFKIFI